MTTVWVYSSFTTKDGKRITIRQPLSAPRALDLLKRLTNTKGKRRGHRK